MLDGVAKYPNIPRTHQPGDPAGAMEEFTTLVFPGFWEIVVSQSSRLLKHDLTRRPDIYHDTVYYSTTELYHGGGCQALALL